MIIFERTRGRRNCHVAQEDGKVEGMSNIGHVEQEERCMIIFTEVMCNRGSVGPTRIPLFPSADKWERGRNVGRVCARLHSSLYHPVPLSIYGDLSVPPPPARLVRVPRGCPSVGSAWKQCRLELCRPRAWIIRRVTDIRIIKGHGLWWVGINVLPNPVETKDLTHELS